MSKKICFLMSILFFFGVCVTARAGTPIDDPSYNLSFEWHWPDACGVVTQIYGHTGIDATPPTPSLDDPNQGVWNWLSTGPGFQGVDVFCPEAIDSPTHCHQFPATDGICFVYLQHLGSGIDQVLDPNDANAVIAPGRQYTMKFDALDMGTTGVRGEFYSASADPIVSESFILPEILQPLENCDAGETELDSNCVDFHRDLTVSFIALEGAAYLGETLSIRFEANSGGNYAFMDNVRLEWMWLTPAYYPTPEDGAEDVAQAATLSWNPGLWAQSVDCHEVYFGTSWSDVNDANRSDVSGIYRGVQNRDVNSYSPPEVPYELGKTYYWRVDEVNEAFVGPPAAAPDAEGRWKGDIWSFEVTGYATNPSPEDGAKDESIYTVLSWTPGTSSESHDVYLGTDFDEVNEADDSDPNVFMQNQGPNSYDPGTLGLGQKYYWRIDELRNSGADVIKGKIWSFTVAEYLMVDDMESYGASINRIYDTWEDQYTSGNDSTAEIYLEIDDANYIQDDQSMWYSFRNSDSPYYAETSREFSPAQDWTVAGFKALTLYFRADMTNPPSAVQPMYIFVSDGVYTGTVEYDDPNDLIRGWVGWQEWNVGLQEFVEDEPSLDLSSIASMGIVIGDGNEADDGVVYIDDIRLYPARCVVDEAAGSFTGDCDVDIYDLAALARDWLISGIGNVTAASPSTTGLFGHWPMDDNAQNLVVADTSGNGNDGLLYDEDRKPGRSTAKHSVPGIIGTALSFDGVDDYVELPALNSSSNTITLSAWIKREPSGHIYDGIVMSSNAYDACDPNYTAGLQFGSDTDTWETNYELSYMWTGYSWEWHSGLFVPPQEWTFTALTVAPEVATLYLYDGISLQAARNYDAHEAKPWDAAFHVADQMQFGPSGGRFFPGAVDDVRIYNRTLTSGEILYLALQGPGSQDFPLEPWRANANDDDSVNLKDFAVMADSWLGEILFP
jgi:hypothetical protein